MGIERHVKLFKHGYDETMGARPMARIIQEHIKKPLAEELLFGKLQKGGVVRVKVGADDKLAFDIFLADQPRPPDEGEDGGEGGGSREPEMAG